MSKHHCHLQTSIAERIMRDVPQATLSRNRPGLMYANDDFRNMRTSLSSDCRLVLHIKCNLSDEPALDRFFVSLSRLLSCISHPSFAERNYSFRGEKASIIMNLQQRKPFSAERKRVESNGLMKRSNQHKDDFKKALEQNG